MGSRAKFLSVFVGIVSVVLLVSVLSTGIAYFARASEDYRYGSEGCDEKTIDEFFANLKEHNMPAPPNNLGVHHYSRVGEMGDLPYEVWETEYGGLGLDVYYPSEDTDEGYPGLAYGHGAQMDRTEFVSWGEYYASRGYVTAIPDLPTGTGGFPDHDAAPGHLIGVLDFLIQNNDEAGSPLEGKVDGDSMGLAGFSAGADASIRAAQQDIDEENIVDAITPMANAMYADENPRGGLGSIGEMQIDNPSNDIFEYDPDQIDIPVQLIAGNKDEIAPPEETPGQIYEELEDSPTQYTLIDGANHNQFGDVSPRGGDMEDYDGDPEISREEQHRIARRYSTSYLNYYVRGEETYGEYIYGLFADIDLDEGILEENRYKNENYTGLDVVSGLEHNIIIWEPSQDDPDFVDHYNIYRSEDQEGPWGEPLDQVEANASTSYSYVDEYAGDADNTRWWYLVRAVNEDGIEDGNENAIQEPLDMAGLLDPVDPEPDDGAEDLTSNVDISVRVEHGEGIPMDVEFYDASDDSLIGYDNDVSSGDRAAIMWGELDYGTTYEWYAVADDGEETSRSSKWSFTTKEAGTDYHDLTINIEGEGTTDPLEGTHSYEDGEEVTVTATSAEGWYFVEWTGDHTGIDHVITVTMDSDKEITARFDTDLDTYELTINIEGEGTTDPSEGTHSYEEGTDVSVTATASTGWYFEEWTGDHTGTDDVITVTMDSDKEITAHFEEDDDEVDTYELIVGTEGEGTVDVDPYRDGYEEGSEVTLTAVPAEGWYFEGWTGTDETGEEITVTMDEDKSITAWFDEETEYYELTVNIEGEGTVDIDLDQDVYEEGSEVTLTAVPAEGRYFERWTGDHEGTEEEITIIMDEDIKVTANFDINEYELFIRIEGDGITDPEEGLHSYVHGEEVVLTAIPDLGWYFAGWTGDHVGTEEQINIEMDAEKEITATFERHEPYFEVKILEYDDQVGDGDEITVKFRVKNTGPGEGTQDIVLKFGGEQAGIRSEIKLGPGEEYEGEFTVYADDVGEKTLEINSDDMSDMKTMNVEENDGDFLSNSWWLIAVILIVIAVAVLLILIGNKGKEDDIPPPPKETSYQHPAEKSIDEDDEKYMGQNTDDTF